MSAPAFELETVRRQIEEAAIDVMETDQLVAYARNARTHSDYQVHLIAESIKKWGFTNPVLIDGNGGIIAGHGRVLAAYKLGLTRVPCRVLGYLDEAQKQAYILADNKLAEKAGWDFDMLKEEIAEISASGYDPIALGFEQYELGLEGQSGSVATPDYSLVDNEDLDKTLDDMRGEVKKAIQIEFEIDDYPEAFELVKFWRQQGAYVGRMLMDHLSKEKSKL